MRYPVRFCVDQVMNLERRDKAIAYSAIEIAATRSPRNRVAAGT